MHILYMSLCFLIIGPWIHSPSLSISLFLWAALQLRRFWAFSLRDWPFDRGGAFHIFPYGLGLESPGNLWENTDRSLALEKTGNNPELLPLGWDSHTTEQLSLHAHLLLYLHGWLLYILAYRRTSDTGVGLENCSDDKFAQLTDEVRHQCR